MKDYKAYAVAAGVLALTGIGIPLSLILIGAALGCYNRERQDD